MATAYLLCSQRVSHNNNGFRTFAPLLAYAVGGRRRGLLLCRLGCLLMMVTMLMA